MVKQIFSMTFHSLGLPHVVFICQFVQSLMIVIYKIADLPTSQFIKIDGAI